MEGNRVSYRGLLSLTDLSPDPLSKIVAIWNNLTEEESEALNRVSDRETLVVNFTDDVSWDGWAEWVFSRCEDSPNEKLVQVLYKVCNVSVHCLENAWAKTFYQRLGGLVKSRIEQCMGDEDIRRKLEKFYSILSS